MKARSTSTPATGSWPCSARLLAHEDSPRRAVHAALGIQRAIRDVAQALQAERGLSLQMRIGVNTGLVVVGKIGDDLRMDYTAVGDTTNLAARLQQMAQPGSVVISAATHQQVAGFFETRDLGEMPVKGRAPVRAFEVLRPRGRRTRFDVAVERGLTPLVGRERELATLRERFSEVKAGRGQVVGIAGEAGMGKSRLVLEFRRALAQAGEAVTWLEGHCISFGQASPFLPLIEQLRENFQIDEFDGEPEIIAKVEQGMRRMGELEAHIPAIRYLLSVDPGDPALAAMEGAARRRQLFAALRALSIRGAQLRPLVLVVEDLHWIDTSSEEFLNFTAGRGGWRTAVAPGDLPDRLHSAVWEPQLLHDADAPQLLRGRDAGDGGPCPRHSAVPRRDSRPPSWPRPRACRCSSRK